VIVRGACGLASVGREKSGEEEGDDGLDGWEGGADYSDVDFDVGPGCCVDVVPWWRCVSKNLAASQKI